MMLLWAFQDKLLYMPSVPIKDPDDNPAGEPPVRLGSISAVALRQMQLPPYIHS